MTNPTPNKSRRILTRLVDAYLMFICVWFLLRLIFFDRFWPLALLNTIAEYLFVPLPLLLIMAIWQNHRPSLFKLGMPLLIFVALFGALFLPSFSEATDDTAPTLTVMSFNVLHRNKASGAIISSIEAASPDLVGFQELEPAHAKEIVKVLHDAYPYNTFQLLEKGYNVGLLSRFPIETAARFSLPPLNQALQATVKINNERTQVFVVHLSANEFFERPISQFVPLVLDRYGRRATEVTRLQEELAYFDNPILLVCDCNLTDTSEAYAHLDELLDDTFREAGWGLGHTLQPPALPIPIQRIDYVWHSDEFAPVEAFVGADGNSDHLPVVAKVSLSSHNAP